MKWLTVIMFGLFGCSRIGKDHPMWRLRRTGGGADFRKVRFPGKMPHAGVLTKLGKFAQHQSQSKK